jgi:hypothetical protein
VRREEEERKREAVEEGRGETRPDAIYGLDSPKLEERFLDTIGGIGSRGT